MCIEDKEGEGLEEPGTRSTKPKDAIFCLQLGLSCLQLNLFCLQLCLRAVSLTVAYGWSFFTYSSCFLLTAGICVSEHLRGL